MPLLHILTISLLLLFIVLSLSFQIDMRSGSMHVKLTGQTEEAEKLRCYARSIKGGDKEGNVWIALINTNTFAEPPNGKDLRSLRDAVSLIVCARVLVCLQHNLKGLHVRPLPFQPSVCTDISHHQTASVITRTSITCASCSFSHCRRLNACGNRKSSPTHRGRRAIAG